MRGGGVVIIKHNFINHIPIKTENFSSVECIGSVITSSQSTFKLFVIYCPPLSSISKFLPNLNPYLNVISCQVLTCSFLAISTSKLIISMIKTLNISKKLLQNFSLSQHVIFPTHNFVLGGDQFVLRFNARGKIICSVFYLFSAAICCVCD